MRSWSINLGRLSLLMMTSVIAFLGLSPSVSAATQVNNQSVNVTATVLGPPPTIPAIISSPVNATITELTPLVISGTCGPNLLVKVFNNGQLIGSTTCALDGTFVINTTLDIGINVLTALNYDSLGQSGPVSPAVTITVETPSKSDGGRSVPRKPTTGRPTNPGTDAPEKPTVPPTDRPPVKQDLPDVIQSFVTSELFLFILLTTLFVAAGLRIKARKNTKRP